MKLHYIFLLLFFSFLAPSQHRMEGVINADTLKIKMLEDLGPRNIYSVTLDSFKYYLRQSPKKYKVMFTFTHWCKPCREMHPYILKLKSELRADADFFFVTDIYKQYNVYKTISYLQDSGNDSPIFAIWDDEKYKNSKGKYVYDYYDFSKNKVVQSQHRYRYFTQQLVPQKHKDYGYGLVVVYDEANKPIYASTYHETDEQIIDKVRSILK